MLRPVVVYHLCLPQFVAAFLSDSFPICGHRRVPYFIFALLLQAGGWAALGLAPPSIGATAALRLLMLFGSMLHGVMCDTIVVVSRIFFVGWECNLARDSPQFYPDLGDNETLRI